MKYLILPILKFIWAIFLTIFATVFIIIFAILELLWTLNIDWDFTFEYNTRTGMHLSPYYKSNPNFFGRIKFKTVFHFIWNIEEKRIYE